MRKALVKLEREVAADPTGERRRIGPSPREAPSVTGTGVVPWSDHQHSSLDQQHHLLHEDFTKHDDIIAPQAVRRHPTSIRRWRALPAIGGTKR
jgi:hypothetical protein